MARTRHPHTGSRRAQWWRRVRGGLPALGLALGCFLTIEALAPSSAHAIDLFPLDDLVGGGLKKLGGAALGGLKIGVKELAKLLAGLVTALADLLIPDSFIRAGVSGIRWLVQLPQLGLAPGQTQLPTSHLHELRDSLTWVALTLLPLQIVVAGGRALLSPSLNSDSPSQVAGRAIAAGVGLLALDWLWGAMTHLSNLITGSLLSLPWVADGIGRLLKTLVIGTGGAAAVAEFILPLVLVAAGGALLALLLFRVALEVFASLLWVTGGLALGLSPSQLGHRFLQAWLISVAAVFVLPVAWTIVFVTGAALMLDANTVPAGASAFVKLLTQLFNLGVVLVVFVIALKIAQGIFKRTGASLDALKGSVTARGGAAVAGGGRGGPGRSQTPGAVAAHSPRLRAWVPRAGAAAASAASFPARHPVRAAQAAAYPVRHRSQATQEAADGLRSAMATAGGAATAASTAASSALRAERHGGRFSTQTAAARANGARNQGARPTASKGRSAPTGSRGSAPRNPDTARAATRPPGTSSTARPASRPATPTGSTPGPAARPAPPPTAPPRPSTSSTRPSDQPPPPDSPPPARPVRPSMSSRPDRSARALRWVRRNTRPSDDNNRDRNRKKR